MSEPKGVPDLVEMWAMFWATVIAGGLIVIGFPLYLWVLFWLFIHFLGVFAWLFSLPLLSSL